MECGGTLWNNLEYPRTVWNAVECCGMSWNVVECHGDLAMHGWTSEGQTEQRRERGGLQLCYGVRSTRKI